MDVTDRLWRLQRLCNMTTYERSMEALCELQQEQAPGAACRLLVESWFNEGCINAAQQADAKQLHPACIATCNDSQCEAIQAAAAQPLTLIHGPPGTGKTHTIAHLLENLFQKRQETPVLVTAGTNVAVDNILRKLLSCLGAASSQAQPGRLLRVGDAGNVGKDLQRYCLEAQEGLRSPYGFDSRRVRKALRHALAVFTTCTGTGSKLLDGCRFGAVVVDEASQVLFEKALKFRLDISLFERCSQSLQPLLLDTQYRMHPAIASFPNSTFYGGRLRSSPTTGASTPPPPLPAPVTFINVADGRESLGSSKYNAREADAVVGLLRQLLGRRSGSSDCGTVGGADIGVVTPYRAQAEQLRRRTQQLWPELEISTVDAFQGREKEVIIISPVRANSCERLGFVSDRRRLNVALTRAMRAVVVVGHRETLSTSPLWRSWIEQATHAL
ncbi:hypothetical protein CHLNCDRAFT_142077 [Chlorella variabilis]|uniref:AAA+ ATPase domain-containing protein n=1 Tax=Chlorella variabilis TaxID=554065 RepID=E1Z7Q0_CHLVA|nr:hypothetical protein CHLNCDRAFT_142077 [Chlorella variabilis]EFN58210.1 hypothetical protein CHLNCDRAFT_142077 [Chlorella variabilis]|eukprot:XP_005850312.1 hypothetical protein CHLNCDRAFT_142077 [Chlorella variabilis]